MIYGWHDVFDHNLPVDINIVDPPPFRSPQDMDYFADIILGQGLGQWSNLISSILKFKVWGSGHPTAVTFSC